MWTAFLWNLRTHSTKAAKVLFMHLVFTLYTLSQNKNRKITFFEEAGFVGLYFSHQGKFCRNKLRPVLCFIGVQLYTNTTFTTDCIKKFSNKFKWKIIQRLLKKCAYDRLSTEFQDCWNRSFKSYLLVNLVMWSKKGKFCVSGCRYEIFLNFSSSSCFANSLTPDSKKGLL